MYGIIKSNNLMKFEFILKVINFFSISNFNLLN
jgi:hypothetical protein